MIPEDLYYHTEHEWIRLDGENATLGITHFAQDSLGDIVYLESPRTGEKVELGKEIGEVESTKTTSPIYSPIGGTIIEVNSELKDRPELMNEDPYGKGWIVKIQLDEPDQIKRLMTAKEYGKFIENEKTG